MLCPFRWPADGLFERMNERIKAQIEKVEEMTGDMDPKTNFALIVIQTELERYKYIVRSFLRSRIAKVSIYRRALTRPLLPCMARPTTLRTDIACRVVIAD